MRSSHWFVTALAFAALAVPAHAGPKAPTSIPCAVCGMEVNVKDSVKSGLFDDYKGHRYLFCSADDEATFKKHPAKYAKTAKFIAIPKHKKA